ncbi:MAG: DUF1302 domain-containing protein [Desulfobacterales bacterium]|nr:DUF1302 domain-containing protein [Desulfobacterales bacterium]
MRFLLLMVLPAVFWLAGPAGAGTGPDLDQVLSGFDEAPAGPGVDSGLDQILSGFDQPGPARNVDLSGSISLSGSVNIGHCAPPAGQVDQRGLSRLKTSLALRADMALAPSWQARVGGNLFYDFAYRIKGRDQYPAALLDRYEKEAELGEAYLQGELALRLDLKLGRQIVVWGRSDALRVTDILNPLDIREPGLVDLNDLRLPVAMTRLDYYWQDISVTALAIHEHRFNKEPVLGNDFYPAAAPRPPEARLADNLANQEFGLAVTGVFSGWDLSGYAASFFDDQTHLEITPAGIGRGHSRLRMLGLAGNLVLGNWLLKSEAAWLDGFSFFALPGRSFSRIDILFGLEYSGFSETTLLLEAVNRHLVDFDPRLAAAPDRARCDEFQSVVRLSRDFANDTVQLVGLVALIGEKGQGGSMERLSLSYDVTDELTVISGVAGYQSGNHRLYTRIGANDRLFCELRYSF